MQAPDRHTRHAFECTLWDHPLTGPLLRRWPRIALPDAWLSGSTLAQVWWNRIFGLPPTHGIADLDLVYFDGEDLSEAGEAAQTGRVQAAFDEVPVRIDVKNQARVHLWYAARFGYAIPPYRCCAEAIATFPTTAAAVGVRAHDGRIETLAPFGLDDLLRPIVRPNRVQITEAIYVRKVARWRQHWPLLPIVPWQPDSPAPP